MTTKTKVAYREQTKVVTAEISVESDELSQEEVLSLAKKVALEAQGEARQMTMLKLR